MYKYNFTNTTITHKFSKI